LFAVPSQRLRRNRGELNLFCSLIDFIAQTYPHVRSRKLASILNLALVDPYPLVQAHPHETLLVSLLVILPISVFAQGGLPEKPYIYVQGSAEAEKAPDM